LASKPPEETREEAAPPVAVALDNAPTTPGAVTPISRSSDRIRIGIAIQVSGNDVSGNDFLEPARTEHVSRHGASLVIARQLAPEQQLMLKRAGMEQDALVRVVGQMGIRDDGHLYGVTLADQELNFWGIYFPPKDEMQDSAARTMLECSACHRREVIALDDIEFHVFEANRHLSRACSHCSASTFWYPVPEDESQPAGAGTAAPATAGKDKRRHLRARMNVSACVQQPGGSPNMVQVIDISRGGICFRSRSHYKAQTWVQVSVPYTKGAANIFVPGKIVRVRPLNDHLTEYGVQYVKA
jgi:hypothetical protein